MMLELKLMQFAFAVYISFICHYQIVRMTESSKNENLY